jgi:transglutaminase-like putative cysteine protease
MSNLLTSDAPVVGTDPALIDVDGHLVPAVLEIGCRFEFDVPSPVAAIVVVEPHESEGHRILTEQFDPPAATPSTTFRDVFGNQCRRFLLPAGRATFSYRATVANDAGFDPVDHSAVEHDPLALPDDVLGFLLPSRYCPSDELAAVACERFGAVPAGWDRVESIARWANGHLTFRYGSSSPTKTAADAYRDRTGVCRDFAHLTITMCRALNIPARYVVGYLPDIAVPDPGTPMDFCAWTEVYLGGRWYTFDPRNHGQRRIGRTVIGRGRDAADVAMTTTFGRADLREMTVCARAVPA